MSAIQKHLKEKVWKDSAMPMRSNVKCVDGFSVSVQASSFHYSRPRNDEGPYTHVEMGFPNQYMGQEFVEYCEDDSDPTGTVYGYVPVELVDALIEQHGGLVEG